jgi:hypothetical protein
MMTVSTALASVGASAPAELAVLIEDNAPLDTFGALELDVSRFTSSELIQRIEATLVVTEVMAVYRAKYLRELRDRDYPITGREQGKGVASTRAGWPQCLKQHFGDRLPPSYANAEIAGLENLEAAWKSVQFRELPATHEKSGKISASMLQELGRADKSVGAELGARLLNGELSGKRDMRAAVKEANAAAKLVGIKSVQPAAPKPAPRPMALKALPIAPPAGGDTYSLAKWRQVPQVTEELEWMKAHVEKMRLAAVKYRNLCKQLEDRLAKGIADNRKRPAEMTVYATIWKEGGYDFDEALESVTSELSEAHRLWGISMPLCHGAAQLVE